MHVAAKGSSTFLPLPERGANVAHSRMEMAVSYQVKIIRKKSRLTLNDGGFLDCV